MSDPGFVSLRPLLNFFEPPAADDERDDADPARDTADPAPFGLDLTALAGPPLQAAEEVLATTGQVLREGGSLALRGLLLMLATIPSDTPADERARWAAPATTTANDAGTGASPDAAAQVMPARLESQPRDPWLRPLDEPGTAFIDPRHLPPVDADRAVASGRGTPRDPKASRSGHGEIDGGMPDPATANPSTANPTPADTAADTQSDAAPRATPSPVPHAEASAKAAGLLDALRASAAGAPAGLPALADRLLQAMHTARMGRGDALPYARELAAAAGQRRERMNEALLLLRDEGSVEAVQAGRRLVLTADPAAHRPESARPPPLPLVGGDAAVGHFPASFQATAMRSRVHARGDVQDAACLGLLQGLAASQAGPGFAMPGLPLLGARMGYAGKTLADAYPRLRDHGVTIAVREVDANGSLSRRNVVTAMPTPAQLHAAIERLQAKLGLAEVDPRDSGSAPAAPLRLDRPTEAQVQAFERLPDRPAGKAAAGDLRDLVALQLLKGLAHGGFAVPSVIPTAKEMGQRIGVGPRTVLESLERLPPELVRVEVTYVQLDDRLAYRLVLTALPSPERLEALTKSLEAKTRAPNTHHGQPNPSKE